MSDPDSGTADKNRRGTERVLACYPAEISHPRVGKAGLALIRDLSVTGALLLLQAELPVGDELSLQLFILEDPAVALLAHARVIRTSVQPLKSDVLWRCSTAIEFVPSLEQHRAAIEALARRLASEA